MPLQGCNQFWQNLEKGVRKQCSECAGMSVRMHVYITKTNSCAHFNVTGNFFILCLVPFQFFNLTVSPDISDQTSVVISDAGPTFCITAFLCASGSHCRCRHFTFFYITSLAGRSTLPVPIIAILHVISAQ